MPSFCGCVLKPHAEGTILCPTPVRPNCSQQKFDSWPQPQASMPERRGSLKVSKLLPLRGKYYIYIYTFFSLQRSSPSSDQQHKQRLKRPPLPVIDSPDKRVSKVIFNSLKCSNQKLPPSLTPPPKKKKNLIQRSYSCVPAPLNNLHFSPGEPLTHPHSTLSLFFSSHDHLVIYIFQDSFMYFIYFNLGNGDVDLIGDSSKVDAFHTSANLVIISHVWC